MASDLDNVIFSLTIIIIVVAVKEIYDENKLACYNDLLQKANGTSREENPSMFENQSVSEEFEFCYILNITEAFKNGLLTDGCEITINEKFYDDEPLIRGLKSDAEPENLTQEQFKEFINQYEEHEASLSSVPYGGFELWTREKIQEVSPPQKENKFGLEDSVHMMKYILGGLCGGLLCLILMMFLFTRFIYPRLHPQTNNAQTNNIQVITSERSNNLPGMADLPPDYLNIEEYPKVESPTPASPPPYVFPPAYTDIQKETK